MTDKPIIFSAPMIRALLAGRKTQTRRVLNPQPETGVRFSGFERDGQALFTKGCFYGKQRLPYAPGDRLWVKEAWRCSARHDASTPRDLTPRSMTIAFEAGGSMANQDSRNDWRSSPASYTDAPWIGRYRHARFMPRWASRITLLVTDVRVQRVQDISEADAEAEGAMVEYGDGAEISHRRAFNLIWNRLHGPDAWDANPWVVAITFTVHERNIDALTEPPEGGHDRAALEGGAG